MLHHFVVFVAKNFWVFISCAVHRNKLVDILINNINGVINKNLSLSFFPSNIKLAWKAKQKQRELTKNQLVFYFFAFFLKTQDIRKSETPIFEIFWPPDYFSNKPFYENVAVPQYFVYAIK